MNTLRMAEDFVRRAARFLREASLALSEGDWATCLRRSQECVEMSLKGVLRLVGVEYPRVHDVSDVLPTLGRSALPGWFRDELPYLAETCRSLAKLRGLAMYGSEDELKPASELFSEDDARRAYGDAEKVLRLCTSIVEAWRSTSAELS